MLLKQLDNNNYISDDEGAGNNQPDNYVSNDAQTENEPDVSNTDEDEVDTGITENTEAGTENENANEDKSRTTTTTTTNRWTAPKQKKEQSKIKDKGDIQVRK